MYYVVVNHSYCLQTADYRLTKMPELPEVETIVRQLDAKLRGRTIRSVVLLQSGRETPRGKKFEAALAGKRIKNISRRAKLLVWNFTDGSALIAHLKMTGRFVFVGKGYQPQKHDRAVFIFTEHGSRRARHASPWPPRSARQAGWLAMRAGNTERLVWSDVRKFGYVRLVSNPRELEQVTEKYGPEPLEVSASELAGRLKLPKTRKVKVALMDQATIAGIGNIYADEALFRAGIRSTRRLSNLTKNDRLRLAQEIKQVLAESVRRRGTSASDYVDASGKQGGFLKHLRVYGRAGDRCVVCGTPIKRITIGQRGTHYCPKCQT